jgi:peptidoglycan-N-acetylglucosamine deacetylase
LTQLKSCDSILSLSLDLDNQWSYMKTHGDAGWDEFPTYLELFSEILLDRLASHGLKITIFVVGQDAALRKNHRALRALAEAGHEIGNHSFHHEPWLHRYPRERVASEIAEAEHYILSATGKRPRGFRGPGYSLSEATLRALATRGYLYDASTFPTLIGPLARTYYFWHSRGFTREEQEDRKELFGTLREGLRPLRPYCWALESGSSLLEIPVSTIPVFRLPMHLSYLNYLMRFSETLAAFYLRLAVTLCRVNRIQPSFLLHPLDFLGGDLVPGLSFFPGMDLPTSSKLEHFDRVINYLKRNFRIVSMEDHARQLLATPELSQRKPDFASQARLDDSQLVLDIQRQT